MPLLICPISCREAIKPNLNKEFAALCSEQVPVTANLFGDDLQTECNNIKTTNKLRQVGPGQ